MSTINSELKRLEILRAFKRRMPQTNAPENISPFDDRVTTAHGMVAGYDLPEIHADIRRRIVHIIESVRGAEKKSQVILLAGDAGTGKTHLLRTLREPEAADRVGYVYVGGSNHWTVGEFQARILDWTIEALAAPSPSHDHPLRDRIRDIGFRATDQLLANPAAWHQCLARPRGRWLGRLLSRFRRPSHEALKELAGARDPAVFARFDFAAFSRYVCDRFLAEKANLTHRYALRVLLTYLFPDRDDGGVGTEERVLHWFRGRADNDYFKQRFGIDERLDRQFSLFDAVKLLVHLFSPAVSKELATEDRPCPPRVFLLLFDQAEGRNELFEREEDWRDFFAHLSELYNTLPNVVVLFTMTLGLRDRLQTVMERQFKDRIRMDPNFVMRQPDEGQTLALYRSRVEHWLRADPVLLDQYRGLDNLYEPFDQNTVLAIGKQGSIRDILSEFDRAFHAKMTLLSVDPKYDFFFYLNELRAQEQEARNEFDYTAAHLKTIRDLLDSAGQWLVAAHGLTLDKVGGVAEGSPATLWLRFSDPAEPSVWVCAIVAKLTFRNVQNQIDQATESLVSKQKVRYSLWPVRAGEIKAEVDPKRQDQIFPRVVPAAQESRFRGLLHVIEKQHDYEQSSQWQEAQQLIREELEATYLRELLRDARQRLDALLGGNAPESSAAAEPAPAAGVSPVPE